MAQDAELEHPLDRALREFDGALQDAKALLGRTQWERCNEAGELADALLLRWMRVDGDSQAAIDDQFDPRHFPLLCSDLGSPHGVLLNRFRTECYQLDEPEIWHTDCPAIGKGGLHSDGYSEDGDGLCEYCGARAGWPLNACCEWQRNIRANGWLEQSASYRGLFEHLTRTEPYLCTGWEVFATATYDGQATLGLCWVKP